MRYIFSSPQRLEELIGILGGLIPLILSNGPGVDVMRPVAAPMIGGMITAPLFSLLLVPSICLLIFADQHRLPLGPEGE